MPYAKNARDAGDFRLAPLFTNSRYVYKEVDALTGDLRDADVSELVGDHDRPPCPMGSLSAHKRGVNDAIWRRLSGKLS